MWRVALSTGTDRWHCTETPVCQPERLLQTMCFVFPNEAWSTNEEGRADVSSVQLNCALIAPCHWSDLPLIGGGHSAQTCVCVCVCVCAWHNLKPVTAPSPPAVAFNTTHQASICSPSRAREAYCTHTCTKTHTSTLVCRQTPDRTD